MSNYEANPVGFLYERYQSSGVSPLYEVTMTEGAAHAPTFTAKLTVPQGHRVEATGSSKKIAKNLAAKLMLDKLQEVEGQSKFVHNTKNKVIDVKQNYINAKENTSKLNKEVSEVSKALNNLDVTKTSAGRKAKGRNPGGIFYRALREVGGDLLTDLQGLNLAKSDENIDYCSRLADLEDWLQFKVKYEDMTGTGACEENFENGSLERRRMCALKVMSTTTQDIYTLCLGKGGDIDAARQAAARTALVYMKTMTNPEEQFEDDINEHPDEDTGPS